jgi:hypothetical protein
MTKLYNRPFKIGFAITIAAFLILNVVNYISTHGHKANASEIELIADHYFQGPNWGVPFYWWGYSDWMFEDGFLGLVLNFIVIVGSAFVVGLLFRGLYKLMLSKRSL